MGDPPRILNLTEDEKGVIGNKLLQKIVEECEDIFTYYTVSDSRSSKSYKCIKINDQFMKTIANLLSNPSRLPMVYKPRKWGYDVEGGYLNDIYRACSGKDFIHNNPGNIYKSKTVNDRMFLYIKVRR